jgi:hypothetical protein
VKTAVLLTSLFALTVMARADLVVTQKIDGGGQSGEQTIRVKGNKARCDVGGSVSVLVDRETGETTTLAHAQKGFITLNPERNKSMIATLQKARGTQEPPKLIETGKKEKVGEYQCDIATAEVGSVKLTYWLAKDYPNFQNILGQLDVLDSAPLAAGNAGLTPRLKDLPGLPMKMVMELNGQKITITMLTTKEENVDPNIFKIPAAYKELPSPPAADVAKTPPAATGAPATPAPKPVATATPAPATPAFKPPVVATPAPATTVPAPAPAK